VQTHPWTIGGNPRDTKCINTDLFWENTQQTDTHTFKNFRGIWVKIRFKISLLTIRII